MKNSKINRTLEEAEGLLKRMDKMWKFSDKYHLTPSGEAGKLVESMQTLGRKIRGKKVPENEEELILAELKRRLYGEAARLDQKLSGKLNDYDTSISLLGIPREDIASLKPWLEANREKTREAVERLFNSRDIKGYELEVASDVPMVRRRAEEFAGAHIQRYHKVLGKFLQGLTKVGVFLRDIDAVPTTRDRSYFDSLTNSLAISIPAICFSREDGTLDIREKELIELYGHEGMGHALNFIVSRSNGLPYFLTQSSMITTPTAESVAQFYENVLLEDLRKSPQTQRALGIEHKFEQIYQEAKDSKQLREYKNGITHYGIAVLGDKSLGNPQSPRVLRKKAEILYKVAVDKCGVQNWVQNHRYSFDAEGNLNFDLISELRYCAKPVERALEEFARKGIHYNEKGRDIIDSTFLKGLWTPAGFVDNSRLRAGAN